MPQAISPERWDAARALNRLEAPTQALIAAAMGVHPKTVARGIARGGGAKLDFGRRDVQAAHRELRDRLLRRFLAGEAGDFEPAGHAVAPPQQQAGAAGQATPSDADQPARAERISTLLLQHADWLLACAGAAPDGALTKQQVDTVVAMIRLAEKLQEHAAEHAVQQQTRSDAEIAEILKRVDERIVELARGYAARLVAGEPDG
ncbi:hypothetical protein [Arvimicrobium flavum]|uniref:hypothetical protein n=1 Tax=Arvimicrobium flavum TaxID=3393320 RepID=UPI00237AEA4F|nr:hypothetical protein [Mesorhizobium shangrilense]